MIPLGTRFDVPGYGPCVAADTGSAVIGATIDIWMPERARVGVRDPDHYHHVPLMRRLRSLLLALGLLAVGVPASSAAAHQTAQDAALARGIAQGARRARLQRAGHRRRRRRPRDRRGHLPAQRRAPAAAGLDREAVHDGRRAQRRCDPTSASRRPSSVSARARARPGRATSTSSARAIRRSRATTSTPSRRRSRRAASAASAGASAATRPSSTRRAGGRGRRATSASSRRRSRGSHSTATSRPTASDVASPSHSAARALRRALRAAGVQVGVRFVAGGQGARRARSSSAACSPSRSGGSCASWIATATTSRPRWSPRRSGPTPEAAARPQRGMHVAGEVAAPMLGEDASLVHLADGSGLSHANRTTAERARAAARRRGAANPAIAKPLAGALERRRRQRHARSPPARRCAAACSARAERSTTSRRSRATSRRESGRRFAFAVLMNVPALSDWDAHATQDAIVTLLAKR